MRLINNKECPVFIFQGNKPGEVSQITVHAEHRFSNNKNLTETALSPLKQLFKMIIVTVPITLIRGFSNLHPVNNTGMVQPVAQHKIMTVAKRWKNPDVGVITAVENHGGLPPVECCQSGFQLIIERMIACQKTRRRAGHCMRTLAESTAIPFKQLFVIAKTEIIIR